MRRALRTSLLAIGAALVIVLAATWYGRLQRCQAELAAWAQIRAAVIAKHPSVLLVEGKGDPQGRAILEAYGVLRTEETVGHYCDAPLWEWWR
jgi:hypothetical protein